MSQNAEAVPTSTSGGSMRLAFLLAMAMFVLVVDTSIMNVSISAVTQDLNTTVSNVQAAIAIESLVSAAFILIGSKLGDLYGRKLAYIIGLLGYAIGAIAMTLSQSVLAVIIFWAILGGLGASLLLPAMQSLIHGNFEGVNQTKAYALVGASSGIAAAVGPLIGGFITTFFSWRVGFFLEFVIIAIVLLNIRLVKDVKYTGSREMDKVGSVLSVIAMGGIVLSILVWQEGGAYVGLILAIGLVALGLLAWWLVRAKKQGKPTLIDPDLLKLKYFRLGVSGQMLQNIALGGLMITMPIYFQMAFGYNAMLTGLALMPFSLSIFAISILAGRRAGKRRMSAIILAGFVIATVGIAILIFYVPDAVSGLNFALPLLVIGTGIGLLLSRLNNYTLSPVSEERVSEAAGVNSAAYSFGLSVGLAFGGAIMLAALSLSFTNKAYSSTVLTADQQAQVAAALEEDAQLMSDAQLQAQLSGQTEAVQEEILRINDEARSTALQVALLVPLLTCLAGLLAAWRMVRIPDPEPSSAIEGLLVG